MGQNLNRQICCPVRLAAQRKPDGIALFDSHQTINYAQLDQAAEAALANLMEAGIKPGNTVALLGRNSFDYAVLFFAALRLGCRLLLLNCRLRASDWDKQISKSEAGLLICGREFAADAASLDINRAIMEDFRIG